MPEDEQNDTVHEFIPKRVLFTLPVVTLEARFEQIATSLEQIFHAMSSYAKDALQSEAQASRILDVERHFKQEWKALASTVDAISSYAELATWYEARFHQLALVTREAIILLQPMTANDQIPPQWVEKRDAFLAHVRTLIDNQALFPTTKEQDSSEEKP